MIEGTKILRAPDLEDVVSSVNQHATLRQFGNLQDWRKKHKGLLKRPCITPFYENLEKGRDWVFHAGGLGELQFNLGFEQADDHRMLRHGVAFSLQPTREIPTIEPFIPRIERYNEYLRIYPNALAGFSMWHYDNTGRSVEYAVSRIPDQHIKANMFIFIGARQNVDKVNVDWILDDFDRLLPLYKYIEGTEVFPGDTHDEKGFSWSPGNSARVVQACYNRHSLIIDKPLRHNMIQSALFKHLVEVHGKENVSGEQGSGNGTFVDVAVKDGKGLTYYEIKTGLSAQSCIREAIGQLLEYSYWPGNQKADKMIIVGEAAYDEDAQSYMQSLKDNFYIPMEYKCFDEKIGCFT